MQGFNVQFKNWLNQLILSHESNKKDEKRKTKQKNADEKLTPEMVTVRKNLGAYNGKVKVKVNVDLYSALSWHL